MPETLISSQFLSADSPVITFDAIPQTFTSLKLVIPFARSTATARLGDEVVLILNGDTGIGDRYRTNLGAGSATVARIPSAAAPSDRFGRAWLEFPYYSEPSFNNLCLARSVNNAGTDANDKEVQLGDVAVVRFGPTTPIFKIQLKLDDAPDSAFAAGLCQFDVYGIS